MVMIIEFSKYSSIKKGLLVIKGKFECSANNHGQLILETRVSILNYFKGQYSLLLQNEILEKMAT